MNLTANQTAALSLIARRANEGCETDCRGIHAGTIASLAAKGLIATRREFSHSAQRWYTVATTK